MPPPHFSRIAAVTGANKGIGLAIVRHLALQYPSSPLNNDGGPLLIYLCARDKKRGEDAVRMLVESDELLKRAKALVGDGGSTTVKYHGVDISRGESVEDFKGFLEREHPDGIDVVVNNAGIAMNGFGMLCPALPSSLSLPPSFPSFLAPSRISSRPD